MLKYANLFDINNYSFRSCEQIETRYFMFTIW